MHGSLPAHTRAGTSFMAKCSGQLITSDTFSYGTSQNSGKEGAKISRVGYTYKNLFDRSMPAEKLKVTVIRVTKQNISQVL